jgi:hypothetical protein
MTIINLADYRLTDDEIAELRRAAAAQALQDDIDSGFFTRLPGGRIIETSRMTEKHWALIPEVLNYKKDGLPEGAVYIGRSNWYHGLPRSKWENPFKIGRDGTREEVIAKFERHLHESSLINDIHELQGKKLVCWCAPKRCHGDVLLRLACEEAVSSRSRITWASATPRDIETSA